MRQIIDNNMAQDIAKEEAKKQLKCSHDFKLRHEDGVVKSCER